MHIAHTVAFIGAAAVATPAFGQPFSAGATDGDGEASAPWTMERMLHARPIPLLAGDAPTELLPADKIRVRREVVSGEPADTGESFRSPGNPKAEPLKWSGKLFSKKPDGSDYTCSAQFIKPNVILTAAHCVRTERGQEHKNFRFALQYHRGRYSKQYGIRCFSTPIGWAREREQRNKWRWDYAMLLTREPSITGHFGWKSGWRGSYKRAVKIGYPEAIANGQVIQVARGPLRYARDFPGTVFIRHGDPKNQHGSSGGAIVGGYGRDRENVVLTVTSAGKDNKPNLNWGPYYSSDDFQHLIKFTLRGCR